MSTVVNQNLITGDFEWTKLHSTSSYDEAFGIAIENDGSIFISGTTSGDLNGEKNTGNADIFLMKLDPNGNHIWTKLFGTQLSDIAWKGTFDESVYLWGETHGDLNGEVNKFLGNEDAFLIKLDI